MKNRLQELRLLLGVTQKEVAQHLGIKRTTYCDWENNKNSIPTLRLVQLANYFEVSIDYLLKLSDINQHISSKDNLDIIYMATRIREIRTELGYSMKQIADILNTTSSTWSAYESGKTIILSSFLLKICLDSGYSIDYVLGRTDDKYIKG